MSWEDDILEVACEHCGARERDLCHTSSGRKTKPHALRIDAYNRTKNSLGLTIEPGASVSLAKIGTMSPAPMPGNLDGIVQGASGWDHDYSDDRAVRILSMSNSMNVPDVFVAELCTGTHEPHRWVATADGRGRCATCARPRVQAVIRAWKAIAVSVLHAYGYIHDDDKDDADLLCEDGDGLQECKTFARRRDDLDDEMLCDEHYVQRRIDDALESAEYAELEDRYDAEAQEYELRWFRDEDQPPDDWGVARVGW